jgi:hypothetical protein
VTTVKDLVKIQTNDLAGVPVVALEIAFDILTGEDNLHRLIGSVVGAPAVDCPGDA